MRFLLDTHILLAVIDGRTDRLDIVSRRLLEDPEHVFFISVASLWEIAIKHRLGKLALSTGLELLPDLIEALGATLIPITAAHVLSRAEPQPPTRDPFDRLLLAQCALEDLKLITVDRALVGHPRAAASG